MTLNGHPLTIRRTGRGFKALLTDEADQTYLVAEVEGVGEVLIAFDGASDELLGLIRDAAVTVLQEREGADG